MQHQAVPTEEFLASAYHPAEAYVTYQLLFSIPSGRVIRVGKLGPYFLPAGNYAYTGSARKNLRQRVSRHLRKIKKRRWHIDYLLTLPDVNVYEVRLTSRPECAVNESTVGSTPVPHFGSTDCVSHCVSHLKLLRISDK